MDGVNEVDKWCQLVFRFTFTTVTNSRNYLGMQPLISNFIFTFKRFLFEDVDVMLQIT